jgi:amino acid transporter
VSGLFASLGLAGAADFFADATSKVTGNWAAFGIGSVVNLAMAAVVIGGLRLSLRVMKSLFYLGIVGIITAIAVVAATSRDTFESKISEQWAYSGVFDAAADAGYASPESWTQISPTILAVGLLSLSMIFVMYAAYTGGEVKNVGRSMPISIYGTLLVGGLLFLAMAIVAVKTWGHEFIAAVYTVFFNAPESYNLNGDPNYNFLAAIGNPNPALIVLINLGFLLIPVAAIIFNYLVNSRCVFAWSFDRVLPAKAAEVNPRTGTPIIATLVVAAAAEASLLGYTFFGSVRFLGGTTMGYVATFATTAIAAALFPYLARSRPIYQASPLKPSLGGIPVITLVAIATVAVFGVMIYAFLTNDVFGANTAEGLLFFLSLWAGGFVIFWVVRAIRAAQEIPMAAAFTELPPE